MVKNRKKDKEECAKKIYWMKNGVNDKISKNTFFL